MWESLISWRLREASAICRLVTVTWSTAGGTASVSAFVICERSPRPACVMAEAVQEYALLLLKPLAITTSGNIGIHRQHTHILLITCCSMIGWELRKSKTGPKRLSGLHWSQTSCAQSLLVQLAGVTKDHVIVTVSEQSQQTITGIIQDKPRNVWWKLLIIQLKMGS